MAIRRRSSSSGLSMCGVVGICLADHHSNVASELYDALTVLQHRGQDAAGIATCHHTSGRLYLHKDKGLVRDALPPQTMLSLRGSYGVGHVRYPTAGCNTREEAQPFLMTMPTGFALAHNGHITNVASLRDQLSTSCHINTDSDSEVLSHLFARELAVHWPSLINSSGDGCGGGGVSCSADQAKTVIFDVVRRVMARVRGGYAAVITIKGLGVLAFRDPHGIRPICIGSRPGGGGTGKMDWAFASESAALAGIGFALKRDVKGGEAVFASSSGAISAQTCAAPRALSPCIFEYVYMARPDSVLDGVSVYQARAAMGRRLARKVTAAMAATPHMAIDVVVPVPETSRISALHLAQALGLPYEEGLTKNRYIGRTFIMPGQERHKTVRRKLSPVAHVLAGRRVLLVDDSIVRGTTSRQIIDMVRSAGATAVYFCSAAPPVRHPNVYGIDLPSTGELIAHALSVDEVAEAIGADGVIYQDLADLKAAVTGLNSVLQAFDASIFDGRYVTALPLETVMMAFCELQARNEVGPHKCHAAHNASNQQETGSSKTASQSQRLTAEVERVRCLMTAIQTRAEVRTELM
ncbi:amidophosphoribosyltransferase [Tribonema minus]|uniref:Amidophosphoribosyltransferase n=1 Tax=Tribonema minus TaxID=303371 RepID=A0A835YNQ4_9STRA|nr:amidophosphoribosyltransferase [Tribonema minus]